MKKPTAIAMTDMRFILLVLTANAIDITSESSNFCDYKKFLSCMAPIVDLPSRTGHGGQRQWWR